MAEEIIQATAKAEAIDIMQNSGGIRVAASFDIATAEGKAKAYNAGIAADYKVDDCIGDAIEIVDFYMEPIEFVNEETGEIEYRPHVILFATDGRTFEGQSKGLVSSVQRLSQVGYFDGTPFTVEFCERKAKLGKMFVLKVVTD